MVKPHRGGRREGDACEVVCETKQRMARMKAANAVYYTILLILLTGALSSKWWMDAQMVKAVEVDAKQDVSIALNAAAVTRIEKSLEDQRTDTREILDLLRKGR